VEKKGEVLCAEMFLVKALGPCLECATQPGAQGGYRGAHLGKGPTRRGLFEAPGESIPPHTPDYGKVCAKKNRKAGTLGPIRPKKGLKSPKNDAIHSREVPKWKAMTWSEPHFFTNPKNRNGQVSVKGQ